MKQKRKNPDFTRGQIKSRSLRLFLKCFLSLCIMYHLAMIFIMPHYMSMIHERLMPYFASYAHSLSFTASWDFYAPNPSYYYYFEYEVIDSNNKVGTFRWPPSRKESKRIYLNHNRLIYHARFFMVLGKGYISRHFIPYFCRLHPEAVEITMKALFEDRPHFKKAKAYNPRFFSTYNKKNMKKWFAVSSRCKRRKKSRNIDHFGESQINSDYIWNDDAVSE